MTAGLMSAGLASAARCLALDAAAVATVEALAAAGIASVLLKGPAVAYRLYPDDRGARTYGDVDLLVAPAQFAAAEQTLAQLGYTPAIAGVRDQEWQWHERAWRMPGPDPLTIDLHRSYAGVGDPGAFWSAVWSTADVLPVAGASLTVPGIGAAALLLALHAASPGASGKPRRELDRALEVVPLPDWEIAADLARSCRAESAYSVGLRLAPLGEEMANRLGLPTSASTVEWLTARPGALTVQSWALLAAERGVTDRLRLLGHKLLPSVGMLRYKSSLARRGPAGLVLAYVLRVGRAGVLAPRALVDLRTANAQARGASNAAATWHPGLASLRAGVWALRAQRSVRQQLAVGSLDQVTVPAAPTGGRSAGRAVTAVLRRGGASCLERSLVRQQWDETQGRPRTLVIGVTAPGQGFHAHAWLDGETTAAHHGMVELLRHR